MPTLKKIDLKNLKLDLTNYRVVKQKSEAAEIRALISAKPSNFWALMNSLLDDGYHLTENIVVLKQGTENVVKEGNRRIASLRIIMGLTGIKSKELPADIQAKINNLSKDWKNKNKVVPCILYQSNEAATVDKIVALTHAKGEAAKREEWSSLAKARHARDSGTKEVGLELLEKFLRSSKKISQDQKIRWGGDYPLTVLDEVVNKTYSLVGMKSANEMATKYSNNKYSEKIELIIIGIGQGQIKFKTIREKNYYYNALGIEIPIEGTENTKQGKSTDKKSTGKTTTKAKAKPTSYASTDPKSVKVILKNFNPVGLNREKLLTLLNEAKNLDVSRHPHAFCFLLRSMFEISAKVYASENGVSTTKPNGYEKTLSALLKEITKHLTNNKKDKVMTKRLHGALTELAKHEGLLSVTSLNQLVHNTKFSIMPSDLSTLFGNVFPLLEEMNN